MLHPILTRLIRAVIAARKLIQPYWHPPYWMAAYLTKHQPKKTRKSKEKPVNPLVVKPTHPTLRPPIQPNQHTYRLKNHATITQANSPLYIHPQPTPINPETINLQPDHIAVHHTPTLHQVCGHFLPNAGYRFKGRNDRARHKARVLLHPKQTKPYDRTHLIPFGFIGNENDQHLIVGWNRHHNTTILANWETNQKTHPFPILWYTCITNLGKGAILTMQIFNARTRERIDEKTVKLACPFNWKP